MDLPDSLPARVCLLAYDPARGRLTARSRLALVLRAAALVELWMGGHLQEEVDGRPQANARAALPVDPVLSAVLDDIGSSRPRRWRHWIRRHAEATRAAVTDQLAAGGWIEVHQQRNLRVLPSNTVTVHDPQVLALLGDRVRAALRPDTPVAAVDPRDAALVALAAAGQLPTVLAKTDRHQHEERIEALSTVAGPAVPALRQLATFG